MQNYECSMPGLNYVVCVYCTIHKCMVTIHLMLLVLMYHMSFGRKCGIYPYVGETQIR